MEPVYNVVRILRGTTVDGPGFRTSVYLAGCSHHCPGCHNPSTWDAEAGDKMTLRQIMEIVREEDFDVTLSGGDPLFNPQSTGMLVKALKEDGRDVWIYTGFRFEEILHSPLLSAAVAHADTVVDGPFVEALKDPDLKFRGSSNQRIVDVKASLMLGKVICSDH